MLTNPNINCSVHPLFEAISILPRKCKQINAKKKEEKILKQNLYIVCICLISSNLYLKCHIKYYNPGLIKNEMSYCILDEINIARKKTNTQIGIFQSLSFTLDYIKVCPGRL